MADFGRDNFGIEIELTGITRKQAAEIVATEVNGTVFCRGNRSFAKAADGRIWSAIPDSSIQVASGECVELVSPILTYDTDMETLQRIIRSLRRSGAQSGVQFRTGIHIHLDGAPHNTRTLKNFVNLVYSKGDLLYEALKVGATRAAYCQKTSRRLVDRICETSPKTVAGLADLWYEGYAEPRFMRYHPSRRHFLNLHNVFQLGGTGTVELRGFNGTLHAGVVRSYVALALAMNRQALTQSRVSSTKPQTENPKFAMRTWLNRIGLTGSDFKACRDHLTKHLGGSSAWRFQSVI